MGRDKRRQRSQPDLDDWFDDGFDEDDLPYDDELDGAEVDDRLHRAFTAAYPKTYVAATAYDELRPTLVANRRRQLVQQGAMAMAAVALIVLGGSAVLARLTSPTSDTNVIAGPANGDATTRQSVVDSARSDPGLPVTSGVESASGDGQASTDDGQSAPAAEAVTTADPDGQQPPSSTVPTSDQGDVGTTPTAPATTVSTAPAPTQTTSTTASVSTPTVFQSACGSVSYTVDGRDLALVDATASRGGQPDIKSAGPEKIEVSFEDGRDHCEIVIEWKNGRLVVGDHNEADNEESE